MTQMTHQRLSMQPSKLAKIRERWTQLTSKGTGDTFNCAQFPTILFGETGVETLTPLLGGILLAPVECHVAHD